MNNKHITDNIIWSKIDNEKDVFNRIYKKNLWFGRQSVSGRGSESTSVENILKTLPKLFKALEIKTIVDIPCGDYYWMNQLGFEFENYIGIDIVEELINENNKKYSNNKTTFICADIIKDKIPKADLILCRDCFIHLSFENILKALQNIKNSDSKYFLTTTYISEKNLDIYNGGFREINLLLPPFNLKEPVTKIFEEDNKYLSLWRVDCL
ncbi:class I SAM-dependent methyltransferase [bacterium]|nr:class I SAM-dependent methyltransferase [bacterium]